MWAQVEQQALAATLREVGPEHDTLCAGWRSRHLAAHLYLRAHRPLQALGSDGVQELAEACRDRTRYEQVIDDFLAQPQWPWRLNRLGAMDDLTNLVEYVVHHEDVRRAGDDPAQPRTMPPAMTAAIWSKFARMSSVFYLPAPVGVLLTVPRQPQQQVRVRPGADPVRIVGTPTEQALFAMGRRSQAQIELRGSTAQVQRFTDWLSGR